MKDYILRFGSVIALSALVLGVTWQYGLPHLQENDLSGGEVVMAIDGQNITANEYTQYLCYYRAYLESQLDSQYGIDAAAEVWADDVMCETYAQALFDMTDEQMRYCIVIDQVADELGYTFGRIQQEIVEDLIDESNSFYEIYLENGLDSLLDDYNITLEMYENIMIEDQKRDDLSVLYTSNVSDEQLEAAAYNVILTAKHILIANFDDSGVTLTGDAYDEKYALAQEVLEKVNAGEDFDTLMFAYTEDVGTASYPAGYTFVSGEMITAFEDATRELEIGEISGLVESEYGWHIIMRLETPLTSDLLATYNEQLVTEALGETFSDKVARMASEVDVMYTDAFGTTDYAHLVELTGY